MVEKNIIRVRHYTERMKECHFKDDFPEDMKPYIRDFVYWQTSHKDFYVSEYDDQNIKVSENILDAIDYSNISQKEIDTIIKNIKNHFTPKKDYRIQLKKMKIKIN